MAIEVKMPRLSDTMEQGTVVRWAVKPGQKVKSGDVIADIETDKATMELQTFDDGTVAELAVAEGTTVKVGSLIMKLTEAGETVSASAAPASSTATAAAAGGSSSASTSPRATALAVPHAPAASLAGASGLSANGSHTSADRVFASPLARKIAADSGVDLHGVHGSGPGGRIVRKDVEAAMGGVGTPALRAGSGSPPSPRTPGSESRGTQSPAKITNLSAGGVPGFALPPGETPLTARSIPLSNMRATIAKRLVLSKATIPHYQVTVAVRMDALLALRAQLNDQLASQGVKLSVNDFLVRACAIAMHQHPHVNSRWSDGGPALQSRAFDPGTALESRATSNPSIDLLPDINIGVAIALPLDSNGGGGGLVVATLRHADRIGLRQISSETRRLGEKARTKSAGGGGLSIEEMSDSTFTISNLGMFGVEHFTAIINPPNVAILAVGAAVEQPVVNTDPKTGAKTLGIGSIMQMTMSSDHRIVDGAMAAQYLATVRELLEKPATLLV
jgi:pyruvate dehydrogenase E2 component (dihydrolipoamide acetyltransferase)